MRIIFTVCLLVGMFTGAFGPAQAQTVATVELQDVSLATTPGRTRIVFDLSGQTPYHFFTLKDPQRVVIDLRQIRPTQLHPSVALDDTAIAAIRTGIQADGAVRYVFDLKYAASSRAFSLAPQGARGHRIVVDIDTAAVTAAAGAIPQTASPDAEPLAPARRQSRPVEDRAPTRIDYGSELQRAPAEGAGGEWSGHISLDARLFMHDPAWPGQRQQDASVALLPEYYREWQGGSQQFSFAPFLRLDSADSKRSHVDIRELYWRYQGPDYAVKAGVDVLFWGVTESQHLVDIINQTDLVENIDGEDKLGQPMLNLNLIRDWGNLDFYVLPWFRERTFPGKHGRLRTPIPVDIDRAVYASGDEEKHVDLAVRWSHYIGDWDIGLAHFSGTSREPFLLPRPVNGGIRLLPYYPQIDQSSLDVQATSGQWLWKLEAIYNDNSLDAYYAWVGGFEYTRVGAFGTQGDLGYLLEYNYDQRGGDATSALQDDLFAGLRWTANDIHGSRVLAGVIVDMDSQATLITVESSRRLGESWLLSLDLRVFLNTEPGDPLYYVRDDDYIELRLARYF